MPKSKQNYIKSRKAAKVAVTARAVGIAMDAIGRTTYNKCKDNASQGQVAAMHILGNGAKVANVVGDSAAMASTAYYVSAWAEYGREVADRLR